MNSWLQSLMQNQAIFGKPNPLEIRPGAFTYGAPGPAAYRTGPNNALDPQLGLKLLSSSNPGGFRGYYDDNTFYGDTSPTGNADWTYVGEHKFNPMSSGSGRDGARNNFGNQSTSTKIWKKAAPKEEAKAAPAPVAAPVEAPKSNGVSAEAGNPALRIPGVDIRLTGDQIGIQPAQSETAKKKAINKGTSQLRIARSVGANTVNTK